MVPVSLGQKSAVCPLGMAKTPWLRLETAAILSIRHLPIEPHLNFYARKALWERTKREAQTPVFLRREGSPRLI